MNRDGLTRLLTASAFLTLAAVALVAFPGVRDELAQRHPALEMLPGVVRWGLADAVVLPKLVVTFALAPWLTALGIAARHRSGRPVTAVEKTGWALAAVYLALLTLSVVTSILPAAGIEPALTRAAVMTAGLAVAAGLDARGRRAVLASVVAVGGCLSLYAVAQHLGVDLLSWVPQEIVRARSIATLGNPDFLSAWLVTVVPLSLLAAGDEASPPSWRIAAAGASAGAMFVATVFTYTRGAWLALGVEGLALALVVARSGLPAPLGRGGGGLRVFLLAGLAASAPLAVTLASCQTSGPQGDNLLTRASSIVSGTDHSRETRFSLWGEALDVIRQSPLVGTGPATFSYAVMPHRGRDSALLKGRMALAGDPHDLPLEVAASSGVPAALAFGALVMLALWRLGGDAWRRRDGGSSVCFASLVGFCATALFVTVTVPSEWLLWLLVGLAISGDTAEVEIDIESEARAGGYGALLLVGGVLSLVCGAWTLALARADLAFNVASQQGELLLAAPDRRVETQLVIDVIHRIEDARRQTSPGPRRARMLAREARVLGLLLDRSTAAMRQAEPFWQIVERRALAAHLDVIAENRFDPYALNALADHLMAVARVWSPSRSAGARDVERVRASVDAALDASRNACRLDPFNAVLWGAHAARCAERGTPAEAEAAFARALELAPQLVDTRLDRALFWLTHDRRDDARRELDAVLAEAPDNPRAKALRARCGR